MRSYTVREDAGEVDNFIFLIKEPSGVQTENLLPVTLRVISTGSSTPADEGLYTTIIIGIPNLNRKFPYVRIRSACMQCVN